MLGETILVLFGAILGWAMSLYGFRVSEKVNLIDDHIKDISKYSEELRLHWSRSFIEDTESQNREIIKIKSLHISIQLFYSYHAKYVFKPKSLKQYNALNQKLRRATTGSEHYWARV